jgi:hypothetical protein
VTEVALLPASTCLIYPLVVALEQTAVVEQAGALTFGRSVCARMVLGSGFRVQG